MELSWKQLILAGMLIGGIIVGFLAGGPEVGAAILAGVAGIFGSVFVVKKVQKRKSGL